MLQGKLSELIHNPTRHLDPHERSAEVQFRVIIDLIRSFTCTSHSTSSSPHLTCILSSKVLADRRDGEGEVGCRERGGAGVAEAGERACEVSRVSVPLWQHYLWKVLGESHSQAVWRANCVYFLLRLYAAVRKCNVR
jgi:hypothetical protein